MYKQAYFLQVAATQGRLELCRFLLQKSPIFHQDDIINGARRRLFKHAAKESDKPRAIRLLGEAVHLLATEYGTDTDDGLENWTALGEFHERHGGRDGPPLPQIPVANAPFMERFAIAIESCGWHPSFFAASFRDDESVLLVTHADEAGKTALHWALEHYAVYTDFSRRVPGPDIDDLEITSGYANLAVGLIKKGSDVHSCWHDPTRLGVSYKSTPLITLLRTLGDFRHCWVAADLEDAVYQWGKILVEAGMSLQRYAAMENVFLRANRVAIDMSDGREFVVAELGVLRVLGQDRLVAHVQSVFEVRLWKAKPIQVPGEWPAYPSLPSAINGLPEIPDTIIWTPEEHEEREDFRWVEAGNVNIKTHSYLVEPSGTTITPPPRLEPRRSLYDDDFFVMTMEKDEGFRQRTNAYTRRRSASAPDVESSKRFERDLGARFLPGPWGGNVHKCAIDTRWKLSSVDFPSLRDCMQGRCRDRTEFDEEDGWVFTWEGDLLENESHAQVAKRFAQRFCPQHLHVMETTLVRVTERAQLAMGPARPPGRSFP